MERMIFLLCLGWENRPSVAARPRERVCEWWGSQRRRLSPLVCGDGLEEMRKRWIRRGVAMAWREETGVIWQCVLLISRLKIITTLNTAAVY